MTIVCNPDKACRLRAILVKSVVQWDLNWSSSCLCIKITPKFYLTFHLKTYDIY